MKSLMLDTGINPLVAGWPGDMWPVKLALVLRATSRLDHGLRQCAADLSAMLHATSITQLHALGVIYVQFTDDF